MKRAITKKDRLILIGIAIIIMAVIASVAISVIWANKYLEKQQELRESTTNNTLMLPFTTGMNISAEGVCQQFGDEPWNTPLYGSMAVNGINSTSIYCKGIKGTKKLEIIYVNSIINNPFAGGYWKPKNT